MAGAQESKREAAPAAGAKPGAQFPVRVLDLGAGSGLLSLMAAR